MRTKCTFVWILAVFVFLFAQVDIAYALDNSTTLNNDHAAAIIGNGDSKTGGDGSLLKTSGQKAYGVYIKGDNSHWTFGDHSQITTSNIDAIAVMIDGKGSTIKFVDDTKIITTGYRASGVMVSGDNSSVAFGEEASIYTTGYLAHGAYIPSNVTDATITFGANAKIVIDDTSANAVFSEGNNSLIEFGADAVIIQNGSTGVVTGNTGKVTFGDGASVNVTDGRGVGAFGSTSITFGDKADITTSGKSAEAVLSNGANSQVNFGNDAHIAIYGTAVRAIYAQGNDSQITFKDGAVVETSANDAVAVWVDGTLAQVDFGNDTVITTDGTKAHVAYAVGTGSQVNFGNDAKITTSGTQAYIARTSGNASVITFGDDSTLITKGSGAHAALADGTGSHIDFGSGTTITSSNTSYGAYAWGANSAITFVDDTTITTSATNAHGVVTLGIDSLISFGNGTSITTGGADAHGALIADGTNTAFSSSISFGDGTSITTNGSKAYGARISRANSLMSFGGGTSITTTNNGAHGVAVIGTGSTMVFDGDVSIVTGGDNTSSAIVSGGSTSIEFKGDTAITTSGNGSYALLALEGTIFSGQGGKYTISGDIGADIGTIDLDMTAGSLFTGATDVESGNIKLNMANSRWNVTEDSNLTLLNLDTTTVDYSNTALGTIITTDTLDGPGGTFLMKTDIVGGIGDMLEITNTMNGSRHYITVQNSGGTATDGSEVIDLVDTADATGAFQLTNTVDVGAWQYGLQQVSGGSYGNLWQLYATGQVSTTADAAVNTVYPLYLLSYVDTQTLIQRLGDLRASPAQNGFWFRAHGGSFEFKANGGARPFDMDYWGVQLGYDRKLETSWNGDLYAGIMFGYNDGDLDYTSGGSGSVDSKTLGIYGTYVQPNGLFVDLVLKYQWMDSDFDVLDSAGTRVTGNGASSGGFGASLELGKRISFTKKQQKSGWYVEPQVQMSLQRLGGGYFTASNGLRVGSESYTSLLGRIGILAGYETEKSNFYAKISRVKEFDGDVTILANGQPIDITFDSSWWVYGLGYTSRLDDRNSIYVDLERASGGLFTQKWALKAGWRMEL